MQHRSPLALGAAVCALLYALLAFGPVAVAEEPPAPATSPAAVPAPPAEATLPVDVVRPLLGWRWRDLSLQLPILLGGRVEDVSDIPVDRYGTRYQSGIVLSPLLRLGARFETLAPLAGRLLILAEYEHDLPTGSWSSATPVAGAGLPNSTAVTTELRKAYLRLSLGPYLHAGGGFMTNHWGMGLVANDGAHGWEPGSARFTDPRRGDVVLGGSVGTGPLSSARIVASVAAAQVWSDDVLLAGDSAMQFIGSALAGYGLPTQGGFFLVHRRQKTADGRELTVTAIDLAARSVIAMKSATLTLEAEGALVTGSTTLAASADHPRLDVLQLGAALRATLAVGIVGGVLDLVYASGDQNAFDQRIGGFKADPNFETGLLLFRYAQAAQTGRGYGTASDPALVGQPPPGIERVPTRGSVTNAVVIFPRLWVRPAKGLELYGGVLAAFAPVKNLDPFNTELSGGVTRNALDGAPGGYWGSEFDLGLRYRAVLRGTELTVGGEAGLLLPGSAFRDATGQSPDRVFGGRVILAYRL